jgi:hypothetical protein
MKNAARQRRQTWNSEIISLMLGVGRHADQSIPAWNGATRRWRAELSEFVAHSFDKGCQIGRKPLIDEGTKASGKTSEGQLKTSALLKRRVSGKERSHPAR